LFASPSDFDRYNSDFYLGKLTGPALEATLASMKSLRSLALNSESCRRKMILDYFAEVPTFGDRCGTCDTCLNLATHGAASSRDFGSSARVVLTAVACTTELSASKLMDVIGGKALEGYCYKNRLDATQVKQDIENLKASLPKACTQQLYRDILALLVQKGYVAESTKSAVLGGYKKSWTAHAITDQGTSALRNTGSKIMLPVPSSIRDAEQKEEEKRLATLASLEKNGIKTENLPQEEVVQGDGPVIRAYAKWHNYMEQQRKAERHERIGQLENLLLRIENWRLEAAEKHRMPPVSVMPEHILAGVAYATSTLPDGVKVDYASLEAAGVRSKETGSLVESLGKWVDEFQSAVSFTSTSTDGDSRMILGPVSGHKKWEHAIYKPNKKTLKAAWESSYERFVAGESPQAIAMNPASGRPIQAKTVVGHVLDAILLGKSADLAPLATYMPPPTKSEWLQLEQAEVTTGMDVCGDPATSGIGGNAFRLGDFLVPIVGEDLVHKAYKERSIAESAKYSHCLDNLTWYLVLRRIGLQPKFA
jgi:hypothetical protein